MTEESKQKPKETNSIRVSTALLEILVLKENKLLHESLCTGRQIQCGSTAFDSRSDP